MKAFLLALSVSLSASAFGADEPDIAIIDSRDNPTECYVIVGKCKLRIKKSELREHPDLVAELIAKHCLQKDENR